MYMHICYTYFYYICIYIYRVYILYSPCHCPFLGWIAIDPFLAEGPCQSLVLRRSRVLARLSQRITVSCCCAKAFGLVMTLQSHFSIMNILVLLTLPALCPHEAASKRRRLRVDTMPAKMECHAPNSLSIWVAVGSDPTRNPKHQMHD